MLVDGGKSIRDFPNIFQTNLNRSSVNIIACTHNDADHANGILGYLRSGLRCEELWLPGSWASRMQDLIDTPDNFLNELVDNILRSELPQSHNSENLPDLARLGDFLSKKSNNDILENNILPDRLKNQELNQLNRDHDIETHLDYGEFYEFSHDLQLKIHHYIFEQPDLFKSYNLFYYRKRLWLQALDAAHRIREIAHAAIDFGIPIRWFQYSEGQVGGGLRNRLIPVNSIEIAKTPAATHSALMYLALTTANRESLVFASPAECGTFPGVLFSADSDFGFPAVIPWSRGMIVTAPHHGSESNANVYWRNSRETVDTPKIWVRSDGKFRSRPGQSYLEQACRYCTLCRGSKRTKQVIRFLCEQASWRPEDSQSCVCCT